MTEPTQHDKMMGHLRGGVAALSSQGETTQDVVTKYLANAFMIGNPVSDEGDDNNGD